MGEDRQKKGLITERTEWEDVRYAWVQFSKKMKLPSEALYSGWLVKHKGIGKISQKRFFVLEQRRLTYYVDERLVDLKGYIIVSEIVEIKVKKDNVFKLTTKDVEYYLEPDSVHKMKKWVKILQTLTYQRKSLANLNSVNNSAYTEEISRIRVQTKNLVEAKEPEVSSETEKKIDVWEQAAKLVETEDDVNN